MNYASWAIEHKKSSNHSQGKWMRAIITSAVKVEYSLTAESCFLSGTAYANYLWKGTNTQSTVLNDSVWYIVLSDLVIGQMQELLILTNWLKYSFCFTSNNWLLEGNTKLGADY